MEVRGGLKRSLKVSLECPLLNSCFRLLPITYGIRVLGNLFPQTFPQRRLTWHPHWLPRDWGGCCFSPLRPRGWIPPSQLRGSEKLSRLARLNVKVTDFPLKVPLTVLYFEALSCPTCFLRREDHILPNSEWFLCPIISPFDKSKKVQTRKLSPQCNATYPVHRLWVIIHHFLQVPWNCPLQLGTSVVQSS